MARTKVDKKWKPLAYLILPGQVDNVVAALTAQGLSATLVEETSSLRAYVVADEVAECYITFNLTPTNLHPGFHLMVLDISVRRSTEALVQKVHDILVRYDSDPRRPQ